MFGYTCPDVRFLTSCHKVTILPDHVTLLALETNFINTTNSKTLILAEFPFQALFEHYSVTC